ncbi:MAG: YbhB/YbcL family Raf kinase inhibitor-like protein [Actinomycetota bacterium]
MLRYHPLAVAIALVIAGCSPSSGDAAPAATDVPSTTTATEASAMEITSPAFEHGNPIPLKYSCDGENVSPLLDIADAPTETAVLVLIMDDPDAPGGTWDHWIAYDIPPTESIGEGDHTIGTGGLNSWKQTGYGGPCPPSGVHRYFFKLFALDSELGLAGSATKAAVLDAMEGHVIADATLMGTFTFDE